MKLLTLLITTVLLSACATQEPSPGMPRLEAESEMLCARNCEYNHGGAVRGCTIGPTGATRGGAMLSRCIDDAYAVLRTCYRACNALP